MVNWIVEFKFKKIKKIEKREGKRAKNLSGDYY